MKKIFILSVFLVTVIISLKSLAQTTTINYQNIPVWGSTPVNCLFNDPSGQNSPFAIGGYNHYATAGGVYYTGSELRLQTLSNGSGTGFGIYYPFSQGYRYKIIIEANQEVQNGQIRIRSGVNSSLLGAAQKCTPEYVFTGGGENLIENLTTTYDSYTVLDNYTPSSSGINYFLVAALPNGGPPGDRYAQIKSITIIATNNCQLLQPTGMNIPYLSNTVAIVNWNAVFKAVSYTVDYKQTSSSNWINVPNSSSDPAYRTYTIYNLNPGTSYDWRVKGNCTYSSNNNYAYSQFTTPSCLVPTGLAATNITNSSATISWDPMAGATSYNLLVEKQITHEVVVQNSNVNVTTYNLTGLSELQNYDVFLKTNCNTGTSDPTEIIFQTTGTCPPPSNPSASGITASQATLNWTSATSGNKIDYKESNSSTWIEASSFAYNPYTLSGLTSNTTYDWRVASICWGAGFSSYINGQFTTLPPMRRENNEIKYNSSSVQNKNESNKIDVEKESNSNEMKIFPSPVKKILNISLRNQKSNSIKIEIRSLDGKLVYSKLTTEKSLLTIDCEKFVNGIYTITLRDLNFVVVKKIIIAH